MGENKLKHRLQDLVVVVLGDKDSISQKEMDFIESMHSVRDDILTAFGVPKPIVAVTDDVNRANAETAIYIFQSEVIKPEMERLMEKLLVE